MVKEYKELANPRLKNAIKYINMVATQTKSKLYDMTQEDIDTITERLHNEVDKIQNAYDSRTKKSTEIEDVF